MTRALVLLGAVALLATSCGGGEQHAPIPKLTPESQRPKVPATHAHALAYVKRCEAALARVQLAAVPNAKAARALKPKVAKLAADCGTSDKLNALVNANRADSSVDDAYLGEVTVSFGVGNYEKYVSLVAAGKNPGTSLDLAREQVRDGKVRLDAAVTELPYPAPGSG